MKTFKQYIHEARRNPDQNPKIGVVQALEPYKDDPDIYISFTKVDKIGINPKSGFNTPIGIYTYPVREMWDSIVNNTIPWAGNEPYVWVLRSKNKSKFIKDLYTDYSSKDYDTDIKNLRKLFSSESERDQYFLEKTIDDGLQTARPKSSVGSFWNITRLVSLDHQFMKTKVLKGNKPLVRWNELLRKLGYTGFADKSGKGIIHPSEPTQAVFLSKDAFKVVDKILNKRYNTTGYMNGGTWEGGIWTGGTWLDGTWEDGTWEDGTWEEGVWERGIWKKGMWGGGVWKSGEWQSGTWQDGTWHSGFWRSGTWKNGLWFKGTWREGLWTTGLWHDGTWKDGKWKHGRWFNGIWHDGIWEAGTWEKGAWEKGIWKDGEWKSGMWFKGTWWTGEWKSGIWRDGNFQSGTWEDGTWKYGTWDNGTWKNGTWEDGIWERGIWENGTWKKGTWKYGDWKNGTWKKGTWEKGTWYNGTWEGGTWNGGYDKDGKFHSIGDSPDKW